MARPSEELRLESAKAPTVLVVEDEWLVRDTIARELEDAGYAVIEAESGETALAAFEADEIDLLFTDIRLPGAVDGWRLAETVRSMRPDLPVIYATGYSPAERRQVPESVFLGKPYRPSAVIEAARRLGVPPRP